VGFINWICSLVCVDVNTKELMAQFPETRKTIPFRNRLMNRPIRILAMAGSLREGSYSTLAAKMALDLSKNYGAVTNFLDLRHTKLPIHKSFSPLWKIAQI